MKQTSAQERAALDGKPTNGAPHLDAERYRTLFALAPIAVYSCDASGVILEYNNRAAELWGRKPELGDTDERFCGSFKMYRPDGTLMPHAQCPMGDVLSGKIPEIHDGEVHIERPDGSRIVVLVHIAPLKNNRGEVIGAINCFYDITERRQTHEALLDREARLRLANEELESQVQKRTATLRQLSSRLIHVQDEEHRRIARNLHDGLGQYLVGVKMHLDMLTSSATTEQKKLLAAALESVERGLVETRTLSLLLHPPLLDEVGFVSAASWFTDEFAKRSGIEVKLDLQNSVDRLPPPAEIALFRILQESLTNVHRHSGSSRVEIRLAVTETQALLSVRDFGHGMPPGLLQGPDLDGSHVSVGISGMRERVSDLGGSFTIQSDSHGTVILVALPMTGQPPQNTRTNQVNRAKNSAA